VGVENGAWTLDDVWLDLVVVYLRVTSRRILALDDPGRSFGHKGFITRVPGPIEYGGNQARTCISTSVEEVLWLVWFDDMMSAHGFFGKQVCA
jgi:hypothetical protein